MNQPFERLHDVRPKQALARYAFVLSFILGVGGSILLKINGAHPFVAAGFAALVLVLYAAMAWMSGRARLEPENIGDNCYYLGFLFTLASLAYTLYQMADPTLHDGRPVDIPAVISGFGVALSSTIVGVFLRVLLMQMRPDFVATEREIRADMNKSFTEFKKHLSTMLRQMKAYSTESVQMAAERDERMRRDTELFVKDHHAALLQASEEFTNRLKISLSSVAEVTLEKVENAIGASSKRSLEAVETSSAKSLAAIEEACKEIVEVKNKLRAQEEKLSEEFGQSRKRLMDLLREEEAKLATHAQAMDDYIRETRKVADALGKRLLSALDDKLLPAIQDRTIPALDALNARLERFPPDPKEADATYESGAVSDGKQGNDMADLEDLIDSPFTVGVRKGPWNAGGSGS